MGRKGAKCISTNDVLALQAPHKLLLYINNNRVWWVTAVQCQTSFLLQLIASSSEIHNASRIIWFISQFSK